MGADIASEVDVIIGSLRRLRLGHRRSLLTIDVRDFAIVFLVGPDPVDAWLSEVERYLSVTSQLLMPQRCITLFTAVCGARLENDKR